MSVFRLTISPELDQRRWFSRPNGYIGGKFKCKNEIFLLFGGESSEALFNLAYLRASFLRRQRRRKRPRRGERRWRQRPNTFCANLKSEMYFVFNKITGTRLLPHLSCSMAVIVSFLSLLCYSSPWAVPRCTGFAPPPLGSYLYLHQSNVHAVLPPTQSST